MAAEQHYTPLGAILNLNEQATPFDDWSGGGDGAALDARREALHQIVCALYAAQRKNMGISHVLQALRDIQAQSTDDLMIAIDAYDAAFWGCEG